MNLCRERKDISLNSLVVIKVLLLFFKELVQNRATEAKTKGNFKICFIRLIRNNLTETKSCPSEVSKIFNGCTSAQPR